MTVRSSYFANRSISLNWPLRSIPAASLNALVADGKFRQDLLYRLNVVPIQMPSLRERADDIPLLVEYFIGRFGKKAGKKFRTIDKKSSNYSKPTNGQATFVSCKT